MENHEDFIKPKQEESSAKKGIKRFFKKALFATTGVMMATSPMVSANPEKGENTDHAKNKIEVTSVTSPEKLKEATTINFSQYFETDKAEISPENAEKIEKDFDEFLSKINAENSKQLLASSFVLYGSSDERPTTKWENNLALTKARLSVAEQILSRDLKKYDFSKQGLSVAQIEALKNHPFTFKVANEGQKEFPNVEEGTTPWTAITNPTTGKPYTEAEKSQALQEARQVKFYAEIIASAEKGIVGSESDIYDILTHKFAPYSKVAVLVDNSPSMINSKNLLARALTRTKEKLPPFMVGTFSNTVDRLVKTNDPGQVLSKQVIGQGSGNERVLKSMIDAFDLGAGNTNLSEKEVMIFVTDEAVQDASKVNFEELQKRAQENNCDLYIILISKDANKTVMLPLSEIEASYDRAFEQEMSVLEEQIAKLETKIKNTSEKITEMQNEDAVGGGDITVAETRKHILQKHQVILRKVSNDLQELKEKRDSMTKKDFTVTRYKVGDETLAMSAI